MWLLLSILHRSRTAGDLTQLAAKFKFCLAISALVYPATELASHVQLCRHREKVQVLSFLTLLQHPIPSPHAAKKLSVEYLK